MTSSAILETAPVSGVSFAKLKAGDGRQVLVIENDLSRTVIALNGAHVMSFRPKGKPDLLWMSPNSELKDATPIRGGIPLCLPWFGPGVDGAPLHGFARIVDWAVSKVATLPDGGTTVTLVLQDSEVSRQVWAHAFAAELEIQCDTELTATLKYTNTGSDDQKVEFAFHTYFNIGDVTQIRIEGLDGLKGIDRLNEDAPIRQAGIKTLSGATTHFYSGIPDCLYLDSPNGRIRIAGTQQSAMVWNPGSAAASVADMGPGVEAEFVCVERVDAIDTAVTLKPAQTYSANMTIGWCD
ncbi:D-hexose-6-phosphate mutarotase [Pseudovibrio exalbescens]|uniref:Putative glucose-6-phosphate 1-epimerase n=1 Tax=Pseudovibrio exalbescens TaxID=197461 RepID=A0A1U7JGF8_9HYPH|nr:D-hexose-6-phosphate mutarotase [Pseudovibrio exalbescens]OKL43785.1 hypothetical protein A3843_11740 [Pseudovibrio exalbescens]